MNNTNEGYEFGATVKMYLSAQSLTVGAKEPLNRKQKELNLLTVHQIHLLFDRRHAKYPSRFGAVTHSYHAYIFLSLTEYSFNYKRVTYVLAKYMLK